MLFSATMLPVIEATLSKMLITFIKVVVGHQNTAVLDVTHQLKYVSKEAGKLIELRTFIKNGFKPPVLIFVQSIERSQELYHEIKDDCKNISTMHSKMELALRDKILRNFTEGKIWILICTELMSRGMDFQNVTTVINYDYPQSLTSYIHRIGRTGRAGHKGSAITYFTKEDSKYVRSLAYLIKNSGGEVPSWMLEMQKTDRKEVKHLTKFPPKRKKIGESDT